MLRKTLRSPAYFFDLTQAGDLVNNFSNDLSLINYSLIFSLFELFEGPIYVTIALANLSEINLHFIVPTILFFIAAISFFVYARPVIIKCKEIDLESKNPIFSFFG